MISQDEFRPAVVVVGASRGIGRAIAKVAARERAVVVLVARSPEGLAAAATDVREAGGEAFTLELDLFAGDASARLEDFLSANGLICDVLVNSAGYGLRGAATALPIDDQLGIIDLNIRALTDLTLRFLPGMVARGRGGVLNLGSIAGFMPGPNMALYYASKSFVRSFSEALHQELRRTGVTVTCVAPGPVSTEFLEKSGANRVGALQNSAQAGCGVCRRARLARVQIRPSPRRAGHFGQAGGLCGGVVAFRNHAAPDRPAATAQQ